MFPGKTLVVVVTFNGQNWISKCLDSIRNSSKSVDVIIIDNYSTDDTVKIVRIDYPEMLLVELKKNNGFGKANNIGIKKAIEEGYDAVFLLNQDAWLEKDTISILSQTLLKNPEFGILSPMQIYPSDGLLETKFSNFITRDETRRNFLSDAYNGNLKAVYETEFVQAAGWLISRRCIMKVGGFDPIFFHYGEDTDYCKRTLFHNFKIGFCPHAKMYHAVDNYLPQKITFLYKFRKDTYLNLIYVIHRLKNPKSFFLKQIIIEFINILTDSLLDLVNRNLRGFLLRIILVPLIIFRIPRIYFTRRNSKTKTCPYIYTKTLCLV